ncbi:hypothetical protein Fmac_029374 [Flemingia macrophylla]|uniref:MCM C-terminal AAA(+) ATPase domain-containing protein n=1 Tax=Flemingia macrophylla TaxID=520843 RepID=A0ABD1LBP9_9FABA
MGRYRCRSLAEQTVRLVYTGLASGPARPVGPKLVSQAHSRDLCKLVTRFTLRDLKSITYPNFAVLCARPLVSQFPLRHPPLPSHPPRSVQSRDSVPLNFQSFVVLVIQRQSLQGKVEAERMHPGLLEREVLFLAPLSGTSQVLGDVVKNRPSSFEKFFKGMIKMRLRFVWKVVAQLKELSKRPDIYEILTKSLAPNIWELDDVKKGLLCQVSVAAETNLKEWTTRAKVYDRCHEPALLHAFVARNRKLIVDWVLAGDLEDVTYKEDPEAYKAESFKGANGVLVPGGFGDKGVQGEILAVKYA